MFPKPGAVPTLAGALEPGPWWERGFSTEVSGEMGDIPGCLLAALAGLLEEEEVVLPAPEEEEEEGV